MDGRASQVAHAVALAVRVHRDVLVPFAPFRAQGLVGRHPLVQAERLARRRSDSTEVRDGAVAAARTCGGRAGRPLVQIVAPRSFVGSARGQRPILSSMREVVVAGAVVPVVDRVEGVRGARLRTLRSRADAADVPAHRAMEQRHWQATLCARTHLTEKKELRTRESITEEEIEMLEQKYNQE